MATRRSGRGPASVRDDASLAADDIAAAAAQPTGELGLAGWSPRQLAESLKCRPQAISHHSGDRETVGTAVASCELFEHTVD